MNCESCGFDPCACMDPVRLETPRAYKPAPDYTGYYKGAITKEQFGLELFEAIKLMSGHNWLHKQKQDDRAKKLQAKLEGLLPSITNPDDLRRLLSMEA
jgi:hypothetical protein